MVANLYEAEGALIRARRWRCAFGEIDLIAEEPGTLIFVEVKRRAGPVEDDPVGEKQWRRLEAAAETYMITSGRGDISLRFDLALVGADGTAEIIRNARIRG
ncbi:MAG: YraN family protein [Pikeienuella sp.]